nr:hypothetical protein PJ912_17825 [Pectobacterium colocasium]
MSGYQYSYTYNALSGESSLVLSSVQGISSMAVMKLVDGLSYSAGKESTSASGLRTITLTELQDNGGTANGGSDTATLTVSGSVNLAFNELPTIEATYSPDAALFITTESSVITMNGSRRSVSRRMEKPCWLPVVKGTITAAKPTCAFTLVMWKPAN